MNMYLRLLLLFVALHEGTCLAFSAQWVQKTNFMNMNFSLLFLLFAALNETICTDSARKAK